MCGAVEGNLHLAGEEIAQPEECWCFPPGSECHPLLAALTRFEAVLSTL